MDRACLRKSPTHRGNNSFLLYWWHPSGGPRQRHHPTGLHTLLIHMWQHGWVINIDKDLVSKWNSRAADKNLTLEEMFAYLLALPSPNYKKKSLNIDGTLWVLTHLHSAHRGLMAHICGVSIKAITSEWRPNQQDALEDFHQAIQAAFPRTHLIPIWFLSYWPLFTHRSL